MFVTDLIRGGRFTFQGVSFLYNHRRLWRWACLPAVVNLLVFTGAFLLFLSYYGTLYEFATGFLAPATPAAWYAWLWVGPLRLLAWIIGLLVFVAAVIVLYGVFLLVGTVIAAPFLAVLAQKVEGIATGRTTVEPTSLWEGIRAAGVSVLDELRKVAFFLGVQLLLLALGLIPMVSPFALVAATLFTMLFLPLEYVSFAMDSRQLRFPQRRRVIWQHRWFMLGFGAVGSLTLLIPPLNFLCLPVLVVGGTLLFLHLEDNPA